MDRKWLIALALLGGSVLMVQPVWAGPDQTPSLTPSPTPTTSVSKLVCDSLEIVSGQGATAPAEVEMVTQVHGGRVASYRYHFGDGGVEIGSARIKHKYEAGGNYQVSVEARDTEGNWVTSQACAKTLTLKKSVASQHRAACGEARIVRGDGDPAPATVQLAISASDNSGSIRAYKIDWGDGSAIEESFRSTVEHQYSKAGSYPIKVLVKDSLGEWREGKDDQCLVTARVGTTSALKEQPQTGVGTTFLSMVLISGVGALGLMKIRQTYV